MCSLIVVTVLHITQMARSADLAPELIQCSWFRFASGMPGLIG